MDDEYGSILAIEWQAIRQAIAGKQTATERRHATIEATIRHQDAVQALVARDV